MRCFACNKVLSDFEATRSVQQDDGSLTYPDLCNECFHESGIEDNSLVHEREDLCCSVYEEPDETTEE